MLLCLCPPTFQRIKPERLLQQGMEYFLSSHKDDPRIQHAFQDYVLWQKVKNDECLGIQFFLSIFEASDGEQRDIDPEQRVCDPMGHSAIITHVTVRKTFKSAARPKLIDLHLGEQIVSSIVIKQGLHYG